MTEARARKYRQRMFAEQHERCFYCDFPMWTKQPETFARRFGISLKEAGRFGCTAEHLVAICDQGTSRRENIVAACRFCNYNRHARALPQPPEKYRRLVQGRVARKSWHPPWPHKMLAALPVT